MNHLIQRMKSLHSFLLVVFVIGLVLPTTIACKAKMPTQSESNKGTTRPDWISNPGDGVSASAGTHVRGKVAQEELAIQRAREEFAKRFGVTIESEQVNSQTVANGRSNTVGQKVMHEETKQSDVKGQVKAKWRDPNSDTFWVWLMPTGG